jgi:hypothetical protein
MFVVAYIPLLPELIKLQDHGFVGVNRKPEALDDPVVVSITRGVPLLGIFVNWPLAAIEC